jgi:hypothetical protein
MPKYWTGWLSHKCHRNGKPTSFHYWCSGERCSDGKKTWVATITAESEKDAEKILRCHFAGVEMRFCDEVADDFTPSNRFPIENSWKEPEVDDAS